MKCEMCGANLSARAFKIFLDRAELIVCEKCAKRYGTLVEEISIKTGQSLKKIKTKRKQSIKSKSKFLLPKEMRYSIVDNYATLIKEARIKQGLTRSLLASMVGEKESIIRRIEDGNLEPPISLARRLERLLKINLIIEESMDYNSVESTSGKGYDLTLGDIVVFKKKKEEKT